MRSGNWGWGEAQTPVLVLNDERMLAAQWAVSLSITRVSLSELFQGRRGVGSTMQRQSPDSYGLTATATIHTDVVGCIVEVQRLPIHQLTLR